MRWIYNIQQYIAITTHECWTLIGLIGLLALGLTLQQVRTYWPGVSPDQYVIVDSTFAVASAALTPYRAGNDAKTDSLARPDTTEQADSTQNAPRPPASLPSDKTSARMNLNKANAHQLTRLRGIGPKLAARIIQYRQQNGRFPSVDALTRVKGIGPKKLEQLRPWLFVASIDTNTVR